VDVADVLRQFAFHDLHFAMALPSAASSAALRPAPVSFPCNLKPVPNDPTKKYLIHDNDSTVRRRIPRQAEGHEHRRHAREVPGKTRVPSEWSARFGENVSIT